jgi:simple sugar transport system permease protein
MLLISGEIDLAVGRVFALAPAIVWWLCDPREAQPSALAGDGRGPLSSRRPVGLTNGVITTFLRVPSFITTLGMLFFLNGITAAPDEGSQQFMPGGETVPQDLRLAA